jgi:hydroxymethylglutaryl-CoA reductase
MFFKGKVMQTITGFSKLNKTEKISWIASQINNNIPDNDFLNIDRFWHTDQTEQKIFDDFSENTISNYYFPYGVAPNFSINEKVYTIPMVIEESSVVAAASKAAKFWLSRGGFKSKVIATTKSGQVHFLFNGDKEKLNNFFRLKKAKLISATKDITKNMDKRGGGIKDITLIDKTNSLENFFQLDVKFETCDAMGANFINSVLECIAQNFKDLALEYSAFNKLEKEIEVIMSILSNYTPDCIVQTFVECPIDELGDFGSLNAKDFAYKFERAIQIAKIDVNRAVTHNKGIFNGIDAVVVATGNDFRAIEACGHAYASRDGQYRGLSSCTIDNGIFRFELTIPLALGTVGGLTSLHPMSKMSLDLLENPNAQELMKIVSVVGLAQNFGAISSLITTGIQKGHMKMHLLNILNQLNATKEQVEQAKLHFVNNTVSFSSVREFLQEGPLQ